MFPTTKTDGLYALMISPTSVVVVVFPFVPVMAITSPLEKTYASSISPHTGIPLFSKETTISESIGTPGLTTSSSTCSSSSKGSVPVTICKEEIPAVFSFKASTLSFSLLSNRIVFAPAFDKSPAAPIPLFPVPITNTVLFCKSMFLTSFLYS